MNFRLKPSGIPKGDITAVASIIFDELDFIKLMICCKTILPSSKYQVSDEVLSFIIMSTQQLVYNMMHMAVSEPCGYPLLGTFYAAICAQLNEYRKRRTY